MRTHMTEEISERVMLARLQEEYDNIQQQISILQQENTNMTNRLRELELSESLAMESNIEDAEYEKQLYKFHYYIVQSCVFTLVYTLR